MITKYFANADGDWFVAPFDSADDAEAHEVQGGFAQIAAPPAPKGYAWAGGVWVATPDPAPQAYSIPKDLPWRRMTDDEAATTESLLAGTSARLRQIYNASSALSTGDELFETLKVAMIGAFGQARADQLLAADA